MIILGAFIGFSEIFKNRGDRGRADHLAVLIEVFSKANEQDFHKLAFNYLVVAGHSVGKLLSYF